MKMNGLAAIARTSDRDFENLIECIKPYLMKNAGNVCKGEEYEDLYNLLLVGVWEICAMYDPSRPFFPLLKKKVTNVIYHFKKARYAERRKNLGRVSVDLVPMALVVGKLPMVLEEAPRGYQEDTEELEHTEYALIKDEAAGSLSGESIRKVLYSLLESEAAELVYLRYCLGYKPKELGLAFNMDGKKVSELCISSLAILREHREFLLDNFA